MSWPNKDLSLKILKWAHESLVARFIVLHIPTYHHNVVGRQLALNYIRTPTTHYFLESSGQVVLNALGVVLLAFCLKKERKERLHEEL
jgi:hypothetical protein